MSSYSQMQPSDGLTALYDTLGTLLTTRTKKNVIMVILTDGLENASQKYAKEDVKRLTEKAKSKYNWQFIYLGANHDAMKTGNDIRMNVSSEYQYNREGLKNILVKSGEAIRTSRATGRQIMSI